MVPWEAAAPREKPAAMYRIVASMGSYLSNKIGNHFLKGWAVHMEIGSPTATPAPSYSTILACFSYIGWLCFNF